MSVVAIHVGQPVDLIHGRGTVKSSIFKHKVEGPVNVTTLGLAGDQQSDLTVHGGVDKAVYAYPVEHYQWWQDEGGMPAIAGLFGENLTVTGGLTDEAVFVGDRFRIGESVLIEVTCQREPCYKLGIRVADPSFVERFRQAGRMGFYLRVLETGTIEAGDPIKHVDRPPGAASIRQLHNAFMQAIPDREALEQILASPRLAERMQQQVRIRNARLLKGSLT